MVYSNLAHSGTPFLGKGSVRAVVTACKVSKKIANYKNFWLVVYGFPKGWGSAVRRRNLRQKKLRDGRVPSRSEYYKLGCLKLFDNFDCLAVLNLDVDLTLDRVGYLDTAESVVFSFTTFNFDTVNAGEVTQGYREGKSSGIEE